MLFIFSQMPRLWLCAMCLMKSTVIQGDSVSVRITEQSWALAPFCRSHAHKCTVSQVDIQAEHDQWDTKQPVVSFRIFSKHFQTERQQSLKALDMPQSRGRESGLSPATFSCYVVNNPLCCSGNFLPNGGWKGFIFLRMGTVMPGKKVSVISSL